MMRYSYKAKACMYSFQVLYTNVLNNNYYITVQSVNGILLKMVCDLRNDGRDCVSIIIIIIVAPGYLHVHDLCLCSSEWIFV